MNLHWLLPAIKGIPVLMYHSVSTNAPDGLNIHPDKLRQQWFYLKEQGYDTLSLTQFIAIAKGDQPPPDKAVLITFDDGYYNNLQYAYPLLKELGWQATIFIIGNTLTETGPEADDRYRKLSVSDLASFDPAIIQLGLHGFDHLDFNTIGIGGIKKEIASSLAAFTNSGLPFHKVLAYPYGARPKKPATLNEMKQLLADMGIDAGFRIGNKVNKIPVSDIFEIRRIDIKGTDTLEEFRIKLGKGKLHPF